MTATNKKVVTANENVTVENVVTVESIVTSEMNKSNKMIALYQLNLPIKEIAVLMDTRYNFVYNVVSNYCIKNGLTISTNKVDTDSKKDIVIRMYLEKKTAKEIAIELKANMNYVYTIIKTYKQQHESNEQ